MKIFYNSNDVSLFSISSFVPFLMSFGCYEWTNEQSSNYAEENCIGKWKENGKILLSFEWRTEKHWRKPQCDNKNNIEDVSWMRRTNFVVEWWFFLPHSERYYVRIHEKWWWWRICNKFFDNKMCFFFLFSSARLHQFS